MSYIQRELEDKLTETFRGSDQKGVILAGVVGCGKTTLVNETLKGLKNDYKIFTFSGDDTLFRNAIHEDTAYIFKHIRSQTQGRALVFVDEVQKSEDIFDAVKYCFDQGDISFIISGSNPDYLNTVAKKRLQRRADLLILQPFSLPEILAHRGFIGLKDTALFKDMLFSNEIEDMGIKTDLRPEISQVVKEYIVYGGLPLAYLAQTRDEKLAEIKKVVERGFESLSVGNENVSDAVKIELAMLNSQEFTYQGLEKDAKAVLCSPRYH